MLRFLKGFFSNNNEELKRIINEDAFLVDVRSQSEYNSGHVKGSSNIPLNEINNQLEKFKDKKHIIVFCRSGIRSSQAKALLQQNGFLNVTNGKTWQNVNQFVNN